MPWKRIKNCVYNAETGKKKGCSRSAEEAKAYMRALYANVSESRKPKKKGRGD